MKEHGRAYLFWVCFVSLVATSFGFISRVFMLGDWQKAFNLSETQMGEIFGAGLWPFAISIVLFSLVVDRFGYGRALWFAFACHMVSGVLTIMATGYQSLYWAAFIGALGSGTVEAVINPVIATLYPREKTKWLNILHAGWPVGLMLAGMLTIVLGGMGVTNWKIKVAIVFIPVILYGVMLIRCKFPISERVAAGISYKEMLREAGGVGIFIVTILVVCELGRVIAAAAGVPTPWGVLIGASLAVSLAYGIFVRSAGRPMYILMLLIMLVLATTELGTDGWIKELMGPAMETIGLDGGWVLVYTALLMAVLRFCVGPILKLTRLSPLGLLACSSLMAAVGIIWLSRIESAGPAILIAATIYGAGQCFFWPTTLGFVSEQFPKGGALTLNAIAGAGMLGVGILGGAWLGYIQNTSMEAQVGRDMPALEEQIMGERKESMFGSYRPIDQENVDAMVAASPGEAAEKVNADLKGVRKRAKSQALFKVSVLPVLMLFSYLGLILYFRRKGGYEPVHLEMKGADAGGV